MPKYASVGTLIKQLRLDNNLSQEQLANLMHISRSLITKIESGTRIPTQEQLITLSKILTFDLVTFADKISSYKSLEHYLLAYKLKNLINSGSTETISAILEAESILNEFTYGEPFALKTYCEIYILLNLKNDINSAYNRCLDYLEINIVNLISFTPKINMPRQYYSIIVVLTYCFNAFEDYSNLILLENSLVNYLENLYFNPYTPFNDVDFFYKKLYIISLNNLADAEFKIKNYDTAYKLCNRGIAQSNKLNVLSILPMLFKLKIEILYNLENIHEARHVFSQFQLICEITDNSEYFEKTKAYFNKE